MILSMSRQLNKICKTHLLKHYFQFINKRVNFMMSDQKTKEDQSQPVDDQKGTQYSNWILARSAKFNHDISYLKRKYNRDRYNIHKLTNMDFMCSLVNRQQKYNLNLNENIVLLAQMNHICNVLKKDKGIYQQFKKLTNKIMIGIQDPQDYVCIGTFMNALVDLGQYNQLLWIYIMDALFVKKYDQQYDQLFGMYSGLYKYKKNIQEFSDYFQIQRNKVIYNIPIIYRNSLQTVRQYVKYNIYNLKQCRILFRSLHHAKINQTYFWKSVYNWFNIYIKEQLQQKQFQEYFIVSQSSIDKVLFDDGLIRPRSILQQLSQIAFILSQHGYVSTRCITFLQNLIIYSIEKGSDLFIKFLDMDKQQNQKDNKRQQLLNEHVKLIRQQQQKQLNQMQKSYKTIFVNPTQLNSQSIINIIIVIKRSFNKYQHQDDNSLQKKYNQRRAVDSRLMNWLVVRLCQPKMKYTVNQLLKVIQCKDLLTSMKIDIKSLVVQKIKDVRSKQCSLHDLQDIFMFLPLLEFQSISYILEHFLLRAHPKDILQLTKLFQRQSMSPQDYETFGQVQQKQELPSKQTKIDRSHLLPKEKNKRWMPYLVKYFLKLPGAANAHENYYSFEENCYFFYILLKNHEYWQQHGDQEYFGQLQKLKQSIKTASYTRGFKLQMGTYFYKLLNYVDLAQFFDGG